MWMLSAAGEIARKYSFQMYYDTEAYNEDDVEDAKARAAEHEAAAAADNFLSTTTSDLASAAAASPSAAAAAAAAAGAGAGAAGAGAAGAGETQQKPKPKFDERAAAAARAAEVKTAWPEKAELPAVKGAGESDPTVDEDLSALSLDLKSPNNGRAVVAAQAAIGIGRQQDEASAAGAADGAAAADDGAAAADDGKAAAQQQSVLDPATPSSTSRIRLGVSDCLIGSQVRYDKRHCANLYVMRVLGRFADLEAVCPEMAIGLGTPRDTIRLVDEKGIDGLTDIEDMVPMPRVVPEDDRLSAAAAAAKAVARASEATGDGDDDASEDASEDAKMRVRTEYRLLTRTTLEDLTDRMNRWAAAAIVQLRDRHGGLDGFILKSGSPTCGMRTSVYAKPEQRGGAQGSTPGVWCNALQQSWPELPLIEEGRLASPELREHFLTRVFAHWRFRQLARNLKALTAFHSSHKYLLMAHHAPGVSACGRILAAWKRDYRTADALFAAYHREFFTAMSHQPNKGSWRNALQHMAGYFRGSLPDEDRAEVTKAIEDFAEGMAPLLLPLRLIQMHAKRHDIPFIESQVALAPTPSDFKPGAYITDDVKTTQLAASLPELSI